jgi:hypothetical protein
VEAGCRARCGDRHVRIAQRLVELSDFYARANDASQVALDAARAGTEAEFRTLAGKLRTACDACHASYQKPD